MKLTPFICKFSYNNGDAKLDGYIVYVKHLLLEK